MWQSHQIHIHAFVHLDKSQQHLNPENIVRSIQKKPIIVSQDTKPVLNTKMWQYVSCYVP